jgi:L-ascorbate metabolism protein UlaG (beta-lactamase superfamily)
MIKRDFLKLGAAGTLMASVASTRAEANENDDQISIRWLGGATMEIRVGGINILTDPCFGEGEEAFKMADPNENFDPAKGPNVRSHARLSAFPGLTVREFDTVLLSHAHEDHFDQTAQASLGSDVKITCPTHDYEALTEKGLNAHALAHGKSLALERGDARIEITAIPAIHSTNAGIAEFLGDGNGYYLRAIASGRIQDIYWAGDTFLSEQVLDEVTQHPVPDLFIPHIGAVGNNGPLGQLSLNGEQAVQAMQTLSAKCTLPIHHSTFSLYQEPVEAFVAAHQVADDAGDLKVLAEGEVLRF